MFSHFILFIWDKLYKSAFPTTRIKQEKGININVWKFKVFITHPAIPLFTGSPPLIIIFLGLGDRLASDLVASFCAFFDGPQLALTSPSPIPRHGRCLFQPFQTYSPPAQSKCSIGCSCRWHYNSSFCFSNGKWLKISPPSKPDDSSSVKFCFPSTWIRFDI